MSLPTYNQEVSVTTEEQVSGVKNSDALWPNRLTGLLAWAGVFVTGVLTYSHWAEKALPCGKGSGCDLVTQSEYSMVGPIPVAIIGLFGYLLLASLSVLRPILGKPKWRILSNASLAISALGFLSSVYFIFISLSVLHATCLWCISSAVIMSLSFFASGWLWSCPDPDVTPQRADSLVQVGGLIASLGLIGGVVMNMTAASTGDVKGVKIGELKESQLLPAAGKVRGKEDAPITIIEFADFNCPSCRSAAPVMQEIYQNANGKIRWAFRNVPLVKMKGHESSMMVATVSELAADKKLFWQFFDAAYKTENTDRIKSLEGIQQVGIESGLSMEDMKAALNPESSQAKGVIDDMDMSLRLGITATPTFIVFAKDAKPKAVVARRLKTLLEEQPYKGILEGG